MRSLSKSEIFYRLWLVVFFGTLTALTFGLAGCQAGSPSELAYIRYVEATSDEYAQYVTNDPTLSPAERDRRLLAVSTARKYAAELRAQAEAENKLPPATTDTGGPMFVDGEPGESASK